VLFRFYPRPSVNLMRNDVIPRDSAVTCFGAYPDLSGGANKNFAGLRRI